MRSSDLLLSLAAAAFATPAAAQDQTIGEWLVHAQGPRCSLATNSADVVFAFVYDNAGGRSLRLIKNVWTLEAGKKYAARMSFSAADHQDPVDLLAGQTPDGKRLLGGPITTDIAASFKASDMLTMDIDGIDDFISVNITGGDKIWAAFEACIAKLPRP